MILLCLVMFHGFSSFLSCYSYCFFTFSWVFCTFPFPFFCCSFMCIGFLQVFSGFLTLMHFSIGLGMIRHIYRNNNIAKQIKERSLITGFSTLGWRYRGQRVTRKPNICMHKAEWARCPLIRLDLYMYIGNSMK